MAAVWAAWVVCQECTNIFGHKICDQDSPAKLKTPRVVAAIAGAKTGIKLIALIKLKSPELNPGSFIGFIRSSFVAQVGYSFSASTFLSPSGP